MIVSRTRFAKVSHAIPGSVCQIMLRTQATVNVLVTQASSVKILVSLHYETFFIINENDF